MKGLLLITALASVKAIPAWHHSRDTTACPYYLPDGSYEFPHLIVPINNSDIAIGHSYFANVTPNNYATIFNFDIPPNRVNQQCNVYFTLPRHDQLTTSDFQYNGKGTGTEAPGTFELVQYEYGTGATDATTGNTQPALEAAPPITLPDVVPGNAYKVWSGNSGSGGVMSWKLSSPDSWLSYFQDWNLCAIGLWVVYEAAPTDDAQPCGSCPDTKQFGSHAAWLEVYTGSSSGVGGMGGIGGR